MELSIGGCASNVAVDLAGLGHSVSLVGRVGPDVFGRFVRDSLRDAGVNTDHLTEAAGLDTSGSLVINSRGEDRRFIHSLGANSAFSGEEITPDLLRSASVLYLGGYCLMDGLSPEKTASLFADARAAGVTTILDVVIPRPDDYWPLLKPVLPVTDVFLPNDDEARLITGLDDPRAQAQEFHEAGAKLVAITCGESGTALVSQSESLRAEIFPVEFVDGTGSGDAFTAGYIHGILNGGNSSDCLRFGSALGASAVRSTGATTGVFNRQELETFLQSHPLEIQCFR
jgi:sugar/nucleoside kinase (ribokinase family)